MNWDPFEELERMHEEIDRLFRRSFLESRPERALSYNKRDIVPYGSDLFMDFRKPICHLQETENNIIVTFELPGIDKENIDLNVTNNSIEIKTEYKNEKKQENKDKKMYSYAMQKFYRKLALPKDVDPNKATAEYKDGILRVELPKKQKETGKKLLIK